MTAADSATVLTDVPSEQRRADDSTPTVTTWYEEADQMGARRPNILYIHSHDTGRYVQPYGHAIPTPHIQRLAEEGVLFRKAFCAAPTCSPSRASLLTGQHAHNSGMLGLAHRGFKLNDYKQHWLYTLRGLGYHCASSARSTSPRTTTRSAMTWSATSRASRRVSSRRPPSN